jgi:hypothetical protein
VKSATLPDNHEPDGWQDSRPVFLFSAYFSAIC